MVVVAVEIVVAVFIVVMAVVVVSSGKVEIGAIVVGGSDRSSK